MRCSVFIKTFLFVPLVFLVIEECTSLTVFTCPTGSGESIPSLPKAHSENIRISFPSTMSTFDVRHAVDTEGKREAAEFWSSKRHVKYMRHENQVLLVKYQSDAGPICTVRASSTMDLEDEDAGPSKILQKAAEVADKRKQMVLSHPEFENGMATRKWEACYTNPSINVSIGFTESDWAHPRPSSLWKNQKYIVHAEAQIFEHFAVSVFSNFNPTMPDNEEFQPPENVYCEGFRSDKKPPTIPDFFSYDAEIIVYESSEGIAPIVSHRSVYYDYPSSIIRTDFYDPLAKDKDLFSDVTAKSISIIHDFNSSTQYNINLSTGKCVTDNFKTTINVVDIKETQDGSMPTGAEFFSLSGRKISYNGQYQTRGFTADVFTALVPSSGKSKKNFIYTWYFSSDRTQVVEKDKVERNVLLRMVIRPEASPGKEDQVDVNFYNFVKAEPNALTYDLTSCYNESYSKKFVLTFPANDALRGSEKFLKLSILLALKDVTELSKNRIFVSEVSFNKNYMFAEFKLLDKPPVSKKSSAVEITLDEAISKLKNSIGKETFSVTALTEKGNVILKPEPNGLNEFAGDRTKTVSKPEYKEGSVIALTVGMLFLGFVLGGVSLNLIMSKKYGVSLFQDSKKDGNNYNYPLNESSM